MGVAKLTDVIIASSPSHQAVRVAHAIAKILDIPKEKMRIDPVLDVEVRPGVCSDLADGMAENAVAFLQTLPPFLLLIVITHAPCIEPLAQGL